MHDDLSVISQVDEVLCMICYISGIIIRFSELLSANCDCNLMSSSPWHSGQCTQAG